MNLLLHIYAVCLRKIRKVLHIDYAIHQQISGWLKKAQKMARNFFSFRGAKLWNSLSANCKQAASRSTLKQYLKRSAPLLILIHFYFFIVLKVVILFLKVTFVVKLLLSFLHYHCIFRRRYP